MQELKKGMIFVGNKNGRKVEILDVKDNYVTYRDLKYGTVFTFDKKTFLRCDITQI